MSLFYSHFLTLTKDVLRKMQDKFIKQTTSKAMTRKLRLLFDEILINLCLGNKLTFTLSKSFK